MKISVWNKKGTGCCRINYAFMSYDDWVEMIYHEISDQVYWDRDYMKAFALGVLIKNFIVHQTTQTAA